METRPPSPAQILVAIGFAVSCFALALFLWLSFGGPVPLAAEGYRVTVPVREATQLAVESDVRISGVDVGSVKAIELGEADRADALVEIDSELAPLPADTRAVLRQKTLLGETYLELTPGDPASGELAEGAVLPAAQVADSVQLDEVLRAFDAPTREAFQVWMQRGAVGVAGRGADLSAALGELEPFSATASLLMSELDAQRLALGRFVRDGGSVLEALTERRGQLASLIRAGDDVFSVTAARARDIESTFTALPTFLRESRATVERLAEFSGDTEPLLRQLRPAARELSPTLEATAGLAPELLGFFEAFPRAARAASDGLPPLRATLLRTLPPLLDRFDPFGAELGAVGEVLRRNRRELTAFLANVAAATNAFNRPGEAGGRAVRYLRTMSPLSPEVLAAQPRRLGSSRANPYVAPGGYLGLARGLDSFATSQCAPGALEAILDPADAPIVGADLFERIRRFAFNGALSSAQVAAPPCRRQADQPSVGQPAERTMYPHVRRLP